MRTRIQQTANCQNRNCLTPGVHPNFCQEAKMKIVCNSLWNQRKKLCANSVLILRTCHTCICSQERPANQRAFFIFTTKVRSERSKNERSGQHRLHQVFLFPIPCSSSLLHSFTSSLAHFSLFTVHRALFTFH